MAEAAKAPSHPLRYPLWGQEDSHSPGAAAGSRQPESFPPSPGRPLGLWHIDTLAQGGILDLGATQGVYAWPEIATNTATEAMEIPPPPCVLPCATHFFFSTFPLIFSCPPLPRKTF